MSFLTFLIGLAIGGALGMFVTCLAVAAGGEDDEDDAGERRDGGAMWASLPTGAGDNPSTASGPPPLAQGRPGAREKSDGELGRSMIAGMGRRL